MKDTNEIEKQLARKADAYIEQKANEMYAIHKISFKNIRISYKKVATIISMTLIISTAPN